MDIIRFVERIDNWRMEEPQIYGWFHIFFLLLIAGITVFLCCKFRNSSTKTMKIICLICEIVLVFLELIKQLVNSFKNGFFEYKWSSFPFQFCETPMYVLPIIIFNKNKKVQNVLISFMATYAMFAGLSIMVYPETVLNTSIFGNIRTLIQHGIQVIIGIYLMSWNRKDFALKDFLYASILFGILCIFSIVFNIIVENITGAAMNMFYLSVEHKSAIFILRKIKPFVPFFVYVLLYMGGFFGCAFLTYEIEVGIYHLCQKRTKKNELVAVIE